MEDLFGILIFIIVAIASLFGKLQERKKREQSDLPPLEPMDLGEEIKRLFGETPQVRKARPAQQPGADQDVEGWTPVPPQKARPVQRPGTPPQTVQPSREFKPRVATPAGPRPQVAPGPVARQGVPQRPAPPRVTVEEDTGPHVRRPEQVRASRPPQPPSSEEGPRVRPEQVHARRPAAVQPEGEGPTVHSRDVKVPRAPQPQPTGMQAMAVSAQRAGRQAARDALEAQAKPGTSDAQAAEAKSARRTAAREMRFFGNMHDVRQGIILMEVLGPPVALRDPGGTLP